MVAVNIWNCWKLDNRFSTDNLLDMSGRCQWWRNWAVSWILLSFVIRILKRQPFFACNELVILFVMIQPSDMPLSLVHKIADNSSAASFSPLHHCYHCYHCHQLPPSNTIFHHCHHPHHLLHPKLQTLFSRDHQHLNPRQQSSYHPHHPHHPDQLPLWRIIVLWSIAREWL